MRLALLGIALTLAPIARGQDGEVTAPVWVAQEAMTAAFRFSVLTTAVDDSIAPVGMRILDRRTGRLVQEILGIDGLDVIRRADDLVRLVDANFDGHPDIDLAIDRGGVGPNNTSHFYLYDPATRRFAVEPTLSALTQVRINRDRTISAFARGGCCVHEETRYRYIDKRLTLIFSETREWIVQNTVRVTTGRLVNGKMKVVRRTVKE